jgi:dTDP-4-dehydrorhamnose 3,5-epimerase
MPETGFLDSQHIDGVKVERPTRFADSRGWVMEFFRQDQAPAELFPVMGYVSVTLPGVVRGPHAHVEQTDWFVFSGPGDFLLTMWDLRHDSATHRHRMTLTCGETAPAVVIIPPGVVHAYACISPHAGTTLNVPNRLYRGEGRRHPVDEVRHEDDAQSPFAADFARILKAHGA